MIQNWQKQGLIYPGWAQIPTVFEKDSKTWRIYFADRTAENKSFIKFIDVEAGNPKQILHENKTSIMPSGDIGTFDYAGQMPSWIVKDNSDIYLYYIGWSVRKDIPYQNSIGLAISKDNGNTFEKIAQGPLLSNDIEDPYFCSTPCVIQRNYSNHLFYLSCTGWFSSEKDKPPEAKYLIKHREATINSTNFQYFTNITINYKNDKEGGICRPSILVHNDIWHNDTWHMWYCYRNLNDYRINKNHSYRIGYATPNFDIRREWIRKDTECVLSLSEQDWDSDMIAYPYVIKHKDTLFMFYNGNGFGKSGFGYATLPIDQLQMSN